MPLTQVHPLGERHRASEAVTISPPGYSAMEGFYIHTANRLEAIRMGNDRPQKHRIVNLKELKSVAFWRAVGAELLAQILFIFVGGCTAMFTTPDNAQIIKISLGFGLCIMALIQMIGHVSGAHINPAVTIAMAVSLNISIARAVMYIVAQAVGAVIGGYTLKGLTPSEFHGNLAVTSINKSLTSAQGLGVEIILTFVLVIVIFGTTDANRPSFGSPSLLIGLTVTLLNLAGISYTGASMNPTRSLGSAVASNSYDKHWIYWVGPIVGGVAAAGVYKFLINPYRNCLTVDEAVQKMLQDENLVAIPRDYFKGTGKNAKDISASSNL